MTSVRAMGVFCEDIRDEIESTHSLIGILPDHLNIPSVPGGMPKLGFYVRIAIPTEEDVDDISVLLRAPDGLEQTLSQIEPALIERAQREAREAETGYGTVVSKIMSSPFRVREFGHIRLLVRVGDEELECATLDFRRDPLAQPLTQDATAASA